MCIRIQFEPPSPKSCFIPIFPFKKGFVYELCLIDFFLPFQAPSFLDAKSCAKGVGPWQDVQKRQQMTLHAAKFSHPVGGRFGKLVAAPGTT